MGDTQPFGKDILARMKVLAIDTTTYLGAIALSDDDTLVAAMQLGTEVTYSERLIEGVDCLLKNARLNLADVDLIGVATGPGSFTGLRIGIATAKGLAVALERPLVGVPSLEIVAYGAHLFNGTVVAIIDARREEVYAAAYRFAAGGMTQTVMDVRVCSPKELGTEMALIEGPLVAVGDGLRRYGALFREMVGDRLVASDDALNFPHGAYCAALARRRFEREGGDHVSRLVPHYVRHSDAEIGFKGRGNQAYD